MSTVHKYKFGTASFLQNTPSLFRRIGNMFFSISTLGGTFAFLTEDKRIGMFLFAMAVLGKGLTEFFSEDEMDKDYESQEADVSTVVASLNPLPEVVAAIAEDKIGPGTPIPIVVTQTITGSTQPIPTV